MFFGCLALVASTAFAGAALDELVARDGAIDAEKAFKAGDRRHVVVPVCGKEPGEVIPGWPTVDSPEIRKALESGQRPVSCSDLGDDPDRRNFIRATKYADRYNRKLLELESGKAR